MKQSFHLALPCKNKDETKLFYKNFLGFNIGRQGKNWIDINMCNNQLTFTEVNGYAISTHSYILGMHKLPVFHFGLILDFPTWNYTYQNLYEKGLEVGIEKEFFINNVGEHISFFVKDPNGYNIEFKCFKDEKEIFKSLKKNEVFN